MTFLPCVCWYSFCVFGFLQFEPCSTRKEFPFEFMSWSCLYCYISQYLTYLFFFLFPSGFFDIIVNGNTVGKYENKGSFGELALMYNQPRAATIVATTEGSLWAMVRNGR